MTLCLSCSLNRGAPIAISPSCQERHHASVSVERWEQQYAATDGSRVQAAFSGPSFRNRSGAAERVRE